MKERDKNEAHHSVLPFLHDTFFTHVYFIQRHSEPCAENTQQSSRLMTPTHFLPHTNTTDLSATSHFIFTIMKTYISSQKGTNPRKKDTKQDWESSRMYSKKKRAKLLIVEN